MNEDLNLISVAKQVLIKEIEALKALENVIDENLLLLVNSILKTRGKIIFTGMGKSGYIAQKISATFSSIGVASFFLHPAEAGHGDLGSIQNQDLIVLISNSGDTQELLSVLLYCQNNNINTVGVTREKNSMLFNMTNQSVVLPNLPEASTINMPTTSIILTLAFWDSVAVAVQHATNFNKSSFNKLHPSGTLGELFMPVTKKMHTGDGIPKILPSAKGKEFILEMTEKKLGCVAVVDEIGCLLGVVTDGDLRRNIERDWQQITAKDIMNKFPITLSQESLVSNALDLMNSKKVMQIFITEKNKLLGVLHMHDIIKNR